MTPTRRPVIDAAAVFGAAVGAGEDPETAAAGLWQAVRGEGLSARSERLMVALCFASAGAAALSAIAASTERAVTEAAAAQLGEMPA